MKKISVALATHNEEKNIGKCLESVKDIAFEIVIVDGQSEDKTVLVAKQYSANVIEVPNDPMFHRMKQKAFDKASGDWILYLDADEIVSPKLAEEIKKIVNMDNEEIEKYQKGINNRDLFLRHQDILEKRDGPIGNQSGEYTAFFSPRLNFFLGKYLRFGGVYPDGVIRLFKKGKAYLPCKDVHEQMVVEGRVGWLQNNLLHMADPDFKRYFERNNRYIDLITEQLKKQKNTKNFFQFLNYIFVKPIFWFLLTQIRHKGLLDGWQGIVFSFFSALRFPRAYIRYLKQ